MLFTLIQVTVSFDLEVYEFDNTKIKNKLKFSDVYVGEVGVRVFTSRAPSEVLT
jgi:hypothetical protein